MCEGSSRFDSKIFVHTVTTAKTRKERMMGNRVARIAGDITDSIRLDDELGLPGLSSVQNTLTQWLVDELQKRVYKTTLVLEWRKPWTRFVEEELRRSLLAHLCGAEQSVRRSSSSTQPVPIDAAIWEPWKKSLRPEHAEKILEHLKTYPHDTLEIILYRLVAELQRESR